MEWRPLVQRGPRPPQGSDPEPLWIAARTIRRDVVCSFCGALIRRCAPGSTTGTRGTKAFFNPQLREFECMPCREEATRAALAAGP